MDLSIASGEEHCQLCHHLNCFKVVLSCAGVIVLLLLTINCPSNGLHRSWNIAISPIYVLEVPQTNGLQQPSLMELCSKLIGNSEIMVLHHLPERVVHGLNKLSTCVSEGDTTKLKILFKVI